MTLLSRPSDPARDFCQWSYPRPSEPSVGALRQEAILFHIFGSDDRFAALSKRLRRVQEAAGRFNTVWGIKADGRSLSLELYFYDYDRQERRLSVDCIADAVPELIAPNVRISDQVPYFMWSIEPDLTCNLPVDSVDVYCNGFGGTISGGICFAVNQAGAELKNTYHFFDSHSDGDAILTALMSNPRFPGLDAFPAFLRPGMAHEQTYVVAVKRNRDAVYLSQVPVSAAVVLLETCAIAEPLRKCLSSFETELGHHLFDVGVDYGIRNGAVQIEKVALYGLL
jgi:hypothetical protein